MESGLLRLETTAQHQRDQVGQEDQADQVDQELLHTIFRGAHSIKGTSATFGFADLARFTHGLEGLLDQLRAGDITLTPALMELLFRATDMLKALVVSARQGSPGPTTADTILQELEHVSVPRERVYRVDFTSGADLLRQGLDPLLLLKNVSLLGEVQAVEADLSGLPALAELDPEECYLAWSLILKTAKPSAEIKSVFAFVEDSSQIVIEQEPGTVGGASDNGTEQASPAASPAAQPIHPARPAHHATVQPPPPLAASDSHFLTRESSSIRVATEKVDQLINLVGELVIAQSMVTQALHDLPSDQRAGLQEAVSVMGHNTRELQEQVLAIRMLPIGTIFSRFPRLVRDLGAASDKRVVLHIEGEETELDTRCSSFFGLTKPLE